MSTVKTATGKIFTTDGLSTIPAMGIAYIRITGSSLGEVAATFGNPEETIQLWVDDVYLANYINLDALVVEDGAIRVNLRKG